MTLHAAAFIATSLDGFIARPDGALDWLTGATTSADDHGYAAFMATIDTLVLGRHTYETVLGFGGDWPYVGKRVVVLSRTLAATDLPAALVGQIELHPGPIAALLSHLDASGSRWLYVDGGQVIQAFLAADRLDELIVTRIPVLIGAGIPLFGEPGRDIRLDHVQTTAFESGFVQSRYRVVR